MLSVDDSQSESSSTSSTPVHHTPVHLRYHPPTPPLPRTAPYVEEDLRSLNRNGYNYDFMTSDTTQHGSRQEHLPTILEEESEPVPIASNIDIPPKNTFSLDKENYINCTIIVFDHTISRVQPTSSILGYMSFCYDVKPLERNTPNPVTRSVNILGWKSINPLTHTDTENLHLYLGDPHVLEIINVLGNVFLSASTHPQSGLTPLNAESYNSFSPFATHFNHQPEPGSYTSTVSAITDYVHYFKTVSALMMYSPQRYYLTLVIIYDFMAFTSQYYRTYLGGKNPTPRRLELGRAALINSIHSIRNNTSIDISSTTEFAELIEMFLAIAENASPIPSRPAPEYSRNAFATPSVSRKRAASPPSLQVEPTEAMLKRPRYTSDEPLEATPVPLPRPSSAIIDLSTQSSYPTLPIAEDDDDEVSVNLDYFAATTFTMNTMSSKKNTFIMDSGAGRTGTSHLELLRDVKPAHETTVTGAFGPSVKPTHTGKLGPLGLDAVYIKSMGPQTLVSLSQYCNAGNNFIGVFTPTEYRMYDLQSALPALKALTDKGILAERGTVQNGIYIRESS
jgi:hypothetical protein